MRSILAILILIMILPVNSYCKTEFNFSGEFDMEYTYQLMESEIHAPKTNKYYMESLFNLEIKNPSSPVDAYISYRGVSLSSLPDRNGISILPYRYWLRYTNRKSITRIGKQKIVFGHSYVLRPLAIFDNIDPTDSAKRTFGVNAFRYRYFPDSKTEIQTWIIENKNDLDRSHPGFRSNFIIKNGEIGFTYHRWNRDSSHNEENITGIDLFLDINIGFWIEHVHHNYKLFPDLNLTTIGIDYTFGNIGNGLHTGIEHLRQTDSSGNLQSHSTSMFFDIPVNYSDSLAGMYLQENNFNIKAFNLRLLRDLSDTLTGEISWDWTNKTYDELRSSRLILPLKKGVSIRLIHSF